MSNGNVVHEPKKPVNMAKRTIILPKKNAYEKEAWQVQNVVCGIDEVGRGCLAGPVVTAAVILPSGKMSNLLKDSKVMSESERNAAFLWIKKHCWYAIGSVDHRAIDEHNIWQATLMAMRKAAHQLMAITPQKPSAFLVDAMPLTFPGSILSEIPVYNFPKGESWSASIAAASIVAKVWRDTLITRMAKSFPGYALEDHKGYATKKHTDALSAQKRSLIHRVSFLKESYRSKECHEASTHKPEHRDQQQTIC